MRSCLIIAAVLALLVVADATRKWGSRNRWRGRSQFISTRTVNWSRTLTGGLPETTVTADESAKLYENDNFLIVNSRDEDELSEVGINPSSTLYDLRDGDNPRVVVRVREARLCFIIAETLPAGVDFPFLVNRVDGRSGTVVTTSDSFPFDRTDAEPLSKREVNQLSDLTKRFCKFSRIYNLAPNALFAPAAADADADADDAAEEDDSAEVADATNTAGNAASSRVREFVVQTLDQTLTITVTVPKRSRNRSSGNSSDNSSDNSSEEK